MLACFPISSCLRLKYTAIIPNLDFYIRLLNWLLFLGWNVSCFPLDIFNLILIFVIFNTRKYINIHSVCIYMEFPCFLNRFVQRAIVSFLIRLPRTGLLSLCKLCRLISAKVFVPLITFWKMPLVFQTDIRIQAFKCWWCVFDRLWTCHISCQCLDNDHWNSISN